MLQIFGLTLKGLLPPKGKGVIRKRGETKVSPLLCARAAQAHVPAARRRRPPPRLLRAPPSPRDAQPCKKTRNFVRVFCII